MTKLFLTLTAVCLCAQGNIYAQTQKANATQNPVKALASHAATAAKTTANASRLIASTTRIFDSGNLELSDSGHLHYNNPSFGYDDAVHQWKYDMGTYWDYDGSNYTETYHSMQTFDAQNRTATSMGEELINNNWIDNEYNAYTYDANGYITEQVSAYFSTPNWDSSRYTNTYNPSGKLTKQVTTTWDVNTLQWINSFRISSTYSANGQLITMLTEYWDDMNNQWVNGYRVTNTYVNNLRTEALSEMYASTWIKSARTQYTYDAQGNISVEEMASWDGSAWQPQEKDTYVYGSNHELMAKETEIWQGSAYEKTNRFSVIYNSHTQALVETNETWNATAGKYEMQDGDDETRYYYEEYTNSVKDAKVTAGSIDVYPNPAKNTLHLRTKLNEAAAADILMTDMSGRMVKELHLPTAAQYSTTVDVSNLPAGTYLLQMNAGGKMTTQKVVVE